MIDFEQLATTILDDNGDVSAETANSADAQWLLRFRQLVQQVQLPTLRPATRQTLLAQFAARKAPTPTLWQRFVGSLSFDSHAGMPAAALRSAQSAARQLQYDSEKINIALDIVTNDESTVTISGQLLFNVATDPTLTLQLIQDDHDIGLTRSDDLGQFEFADVPTGVYQLAVNHAEFEVVIDAIAL